MIADGIKHEKQPDGRVLVTAFAFGDSVESVVPASLCLCEAKVQRNLASGDVFLCLYDNHGELVVASRVFTADQYAQAS